MLGVGVDWSEDVNQVALGRPGEGIVEEFSVPHTPEGVELIIGRISALEPDPTEVRVALEGRHGHLVEVLVEAGYAVVPVNPDLVSRRRGPARAKDDGEDARILCRMAADPLMVLRPLVPHGEEAAELRSIARDDARAARDQRRLLNRLRADLLAVAPELFAFGGEDLGAPTFLGLVERWPTTEAAREATGSELEAYFRGTRHGWPDRAVEKLREALASSQFTPRAHLVRAKEATIRLHATQLLAIHRQRRAWERRMGELLVGLGSVEGPEGKPVPAGEIYLSMPGLGARLAGRVAGEVGDHPSQFGSPASLQSYGGTAPVTRRSGKSEYVVARRLACNGHLRDAIQQWAFCSLRESGWAREFYDAQRASGKHHHAALRALGNR
ncbi:MAG: IS110 family transposase, partial [Acidimicrobiia bacterium]